jgi:hypothetical protein
MNLIAWCLIAHLIGDFLLQTGYETSHKAQGRFLNRGLLTHCLKYAACFIPVFLIYGVSLAWLLVVFGTHLVLDRRWLILGWRHHVIGDSLEAIKATFWLTIVVDQIFHLIVLAIICSLAKV